MLLLSQNAVCFCQYYLELERNIIEQSLEWFHRNTISRNQDNQVCVGAVAWLSQKALCFRQCYLKKEGNIIKLNL